MTLDELLPLLRGAEVRIGRNVAEWDDTTGEITFRLYSSYAPVKSDVTIIKLDPAQFDLETLSMPWPEDVHGGKRRAEWTLPLQPCLFCSCDRVRVVRINDERDEADGCSVAHCMGCGAGSSVQTTRYKAFIAWNSRVAPRAARQERSRWETGHLHAVQNNLLFFLQSKDAAV